MVMRISVKPTFSIAVLTLSLLFAVLVFSLSSPFSQTSLPTTSNLGEKGIWNVRRMFEWRPCKWWLQSHLPALPAQTKKYIRVDCYGGLNQMRRDLCDGVGIARLLNATLVLPKFEVAPYWNESSDFDDVFDVDYFIQQMSGFIRVAKELPPEIASREPFHVDCRKRKGQFDYIESVLPFLLEHHYISITPAMSQRRDRYYDFLCLCLFCFGVTDPLKKHGYVGLKLSDMKLRNLHLVPTENVLAVV